MSGRGSNSRANANNRANQLNPNNAAYLSSRGISVPAGRSEGNASPPSTFHASTMGGTVDEANFTEIDLVDTLALYEIENPSPRVGPSNALDHTTWAVTSFSGQQTATCIYCRTIVATFDADEDQRAELARREHLATCRERLALARRYVSVLSSDRRVK